ncbi:MAG: endonuclease/exonuclease/phosphatase family protein [Defluviitaleaceae bacterium]|nr:endonuclease/exonuclease/phosphatase family protein [Defluviitaleaceae bacterium]
MNILFWNTGLNGKRVANASDINKCLREMIEENNIDLLVLAEYNSGIQSLCQQSNAQFYPLFNNSEYIKAMINHNYSIETLIDQSRYLIAKITTVSYKMVIGMVHNASKLHYDDEDQEFRMQTFHKDLCQCEEDHNCKNTIVIGDFNVNPFEKACVSARNLHAIPFREIVTQKVRRKINDDYCPMFYNPTWKFMGKKMPPYTTYYCDRSGKAINYYWYAFDQVIVRPQLVEAFDEEKLAIITTTRNHMLIKDGKPDKIKYSDHLPLFCVLKEKYI